MDEQLTDRQQRELLYHREHARAHRHVLASPINWDVLEDPDRRWWNAYWAMYSYLKGCQLSDKKVLVVGCGFGDDALRIAKLGARVSAFDLSPDSLQIARQLAVREGLDIEFDQMPAERMHYPDSHFDYIVARDIFHHVDVPNTVKEICRVARPGAVLVLNEIYSHTFTDTIRRSRLVEKVLYPRMRRLIYGSEKPYITDDERKLTELDLRDIERHLASAHFESHFNFLVTRVIPDRWAAIAYADQVVLRLLRPLGRLLAGRILLAAVIKK